MRARTALALAAASVLAGTAPSSAGSRHDAPPRGTAGGGQIVVLGAPGLRWDDVTDSGTPALARLHRTGSSGVLSVRTSAAIDCPADGWLTLGAGNRVRAAGRHPLRCSAELPGPSSLPEQQRSSGRRREGAVPGLLADALRAHGRCVEAAGPGAVLAAAGADGAAPPPAAPAGSVVGPAGALRPACPVVLLQASPVGGPAGSPARAAAAAAVDALVDRVARRPGSAGGTLIVLGLSEAPGDRDPHLHVALAAGPSFPAGALHSASTRRAPYVQLVDLTPTVLELVGIPSPDGVIGQPWRTAGTVPRRADLVDAGRHSDAQRRATVPFFVVLVGVQLLLAGGGLLLRRWLLVELVGLAGTAAVGASYLANLVPWWRAAEPLWALVGVTAAITAVLTGLSLVGRKPLARAGLVCSAVAAVVVLDLLTGAHLQMSAVAGYSPVVAGRFAGIGNVAFGVLAAAALLAAASTGSATTAALTGLVVVVDGAPMWGSDVGGVLALVPAYAVLVLRLAGRTVNLVRLAAAALAGALVVTAFGIVDHTRPPDQQTHLGRFVGQVLDGSAGGVLRRKAGANLALLFHSPITALLPVVVVFLLVLLLRPPAALGRVFAVSPAWRSGLVAVLTASALGFALNDSGAAVPALAIVVALPATLAVLARHARRSAAAG